MNWSAGEVIDKGGKASDQDPSNTEPTGCLVLWIAVIPKLIKQRGMPRDASACNGTRDY